MIRLRFPPCRFPDLNLKPVLPPPPTTPITARGTPTAVFENMFTSPYYYQLQANPASRCPMRSLHFGACRCWTFLPPTAHTSVIFFAGHSRPIHALRLYQTWWGTRNSKTMQRLVQKNLRQIHPSNSIQSGFFVPLPPTMAGFGQLHWPMSRFVKIKLEHHHNKFY